MLRRRTDLALALSLFLVTTAVYHANGRVITDGDSFGTRLLPFVMWREHTVTLDSVASPATRVPPGKPYTQPYWTWRAPWGTLLSVYPIVTPLAVAPLYGPAVAWVERKGGDDAHLFRAAVFMEKGSASLIASATVVLFYILVRRRLTPPRALLLASVFAFGTSTWTISSQALWQHGMAELLVVLALLGITGHGHRAIALAGVACGLMVMNRPPDALLAAAFFVALALRFRWKSAAALLFGTIAAAPFLAYNLKFFGSFAGGYVAMGAVGSYPFFAHDLWEGLAGLTISPAKGLFVFMPVFLFLVARARRRGSDATLDVIFAAAVVLQLLFYAKADWRAGACYGPRYLTDAMPILAWLLVPVVATMRGVSAAAFSLAAVFSIAVQAVGAFCYPAGRTDDRFYLPRGQSRLIVPAAVWDPRNAPFFAEAQSCRSADTDR